ncbi:MAG: TIGR03943 family putative permease subunit [Chthoniobacterales bacterium]
MIPLIQRLLSAGILMAWGTVLCVMYFSGRIVSYLVPTFQPLTVVCGVALVLIAMLVLLAPADDAAAGHATNRSLFKRLLAAAVLVVPLFLALGTSKDEYGAAVAMNRNYVSDVTQLPGAPPPAASDALPGENPSASTADQAPPGPPVNAKGDVQAEVIDLLYAAQLPEMRPTFENKQIEVIGQLMPAKENNPKGDRYDLVRMFMTCCAADAQPIALPVHPAAKPDLPDMTWVKITGKAVFPIVAGQRRPLVENATVEKTQPPEDTFLY